MNIKNLAPVALALAAFVAAPVLAQSVTTTTTRVGSEIRTVTIGDGVIVTQGVAGMTPTIVSVPNAETVVWGPAAVTVDGDTTTTVQQIYVNVPQDGRADNTFRRNQQLR